MPIVQQGSINTTALVVPDLYVQIVPPQNLILNGVPTNVLGIVGTSQWGPVGIATILGSAGDYARNFGAVQNRKYDAGTAVAIAVQQGASNFRVVRATDGTDAKAASVGVATCITFTALFSGTLGNSIQATLATGSKSGTWRFTVGIPGVAPDSFDNIPGTGNAFWVNLAAAINTGLNNARGPSSFITATSAGGTTAPAAATFANFTGGTDGTTTITAATLIGLDTGNRTGMYALRGQGCSIGMLADVDDSTQWTTIDSFGLSEGIYMMQTQPAGTAVAAAVTAKNTAGLDSYASKLMHGDWVWWNDQTNQLIRLVSPQAFAAGRLANLSPEQSSLNKPLYSVVGTQKSALVVSQNGVYSSADLQALFQAGMDVIANPQPGGYYWGIRGGRTASSNSGTNGDNYTRMTNYIAATLASGMGKYVGQIINIGTLRRIRSTLLSFLGNMLQQGMLGTIDGALPFSVICDASNNPPSRTGLGYAQADVQVRYQAVIWFLLVNLEGGQTVTVAQQNLPPLAA